MKLINNIILSSSSEARKNLLERLNIKFKVFCPDINETPLINETPEILVKRVSLLKAKEANKIYKKSFIIAADTIIYSRRTFFHKTIEKDVAFKNLKLLSGRRHTIYTGLTIIDHKDKVFFFLTKTKVKFKIVTDSEIQKYLSMEEWQSRAGSYAIQGFGACFVSFISGSYTSAIGLPLEKLYNLLRSYNLI